MVLTEVEPEGPAGGTVQRESTQEVRVLFIPDAKSNRTSERTPAFLRIIKERSEVVALPAPWDRLVYDPARALLPRVVLYGLDKILLTLRGLLLAYRFRADVVFCETAHHALAGLAIARILGIRCVWDSHGNGKLFYESLGKSRLLVRLVSALEKFLGNSVDDLITVTEADASAYALMGLARPKIWVVPVCVNLADIDSSAADSPRRPEERGSLPVLLFFGSFAYGPNREALEFINANVAPYLERHGFPCEIRIAGRDIPEIEFHPSVRPLGFVPNIYACIRGADLCIVPVRRGTGILTKVLDAMAVGTPLVLTEFAARSIPEIRHEVHAYVAATDEEFLRCVTQAVLDPDRGRAMALRARHLVENAYDWELYADLLREIVAPPGFGRGGDGGHDGRGHYTDR